MWSSCQEPAEKISYDREISIVKSGSVKIYEFLKRTFICMQMKLMKNETYLQQKFT